MGKWYCLKKCVGWLEKAKKLMIFVIIDPAAITEVDLHKKTDKENDLVSSKAMRDDFCNMTFQVWM